MLPYSKEFRREVLAACDPGGGTREVALRFDVSESWVRRIKQERREQGKTVPLIKRRRIPKWIAEQEQIKAAIRQQPDLGLPGNQPECAGALPGPAAPAFAHQKMS